MILWYICVSSNVINADSDSNKSINIRSPWANFSLNVSVYDIHSEHVAQSTGHRGMDIMLAASCSLPCLHSSMIITVIKIGTVIDCSLVKLAAGGRTAPIPARTDAAGPSLSPRACSSITTAAFFEPYARNRLGAFEKLSYICRKSAEAIQLSSPRDWFPVLLHTFASH